MRLRNRDTNRVRKSLPERTSGDFNAVCVGRFRMSRSQRINLSERLEIVQGQLVAEEVEENVLESASVFSQVKPCIAKIRLLLTRGYRVELESARAVRHKKSYQPVR